MNRAFITVVVVIVSATMLQSCVVASAGSRKVRVVATTSIIGDWVHVVGGDEVELTVLVGPDGDPHEYQPVPADSLKLTDADLIAENGLGLESWLDKLCTSARTKALRVVVTQGIDIRYVSAAGEASSPTQPLEADPHAWQSVADAIIMVHNIRDALLKVDPLHASGYMSRTGAYEKQLQALDSFIAAQINLIPKERRKLITSHDAFGYFGQRYGIEVSRNALESVTTEAADPSAKLIAEAIRQIKASGAPVVFLENIQNPKLISRIAVEANVRVGPPLYSDALGQPGTAGDTYLKMMQYNTNTLVAALQPASSQP